MSNHRAERRREGQRQQGQHQRGAAALVVVLALVLGGCSLWPGTDAAEEPGPEQRAAELEARVAEHLARRGRAVAEGHRRPFLRGLDRSDRAFVRAQRQRFENLRRLPVGTIRYSVVDGSVRDLGGEVTSVVERHLQLAGYDAQPVVTVKRFTYTPHGADGRRLLLSETRPVAGKGSVQPWDAGPIRVRSKQGVLGVFDPGSVGSAQGILAEVERGVSAVAGDLPYDWDRLVVVYALSDTDVLSSIEDLPGGDPERLDAVAFPVRVHPDSAAVADHRFLLHPRMLRRDGDSRSRLIRHELVHVALGHRDDGVPTWLAEGVAEYVSVRPIPQQQRTISRAALELASDGPTEMPTNEQFNGTRSGANYGLSWWACEYIADTHGEEMLWQLMDAFDGSDRDVDDVLRAEIGIDAAGLAERAGERIVATFG